jgi:hypothetical protein
LLADFPIHRPDIRRSCLNGFRQSAASPGQSLFQVHVATGLELRVSYGDDLMRSELFRGVDRDERLAETADSWHLALIEKGSSENPL